MSQQYWLLKSCLINSQIRLYVPYQSFKSQYYTLHQKDMKHWSYLNFTVDIGGHVDGKVDHFRSNWVHWKVEWRHCVHQSLDKGYPEEDTVRCKQERHGVVPFVHIRRFSPVAIEGKGVCIPKKRLLLSKSCTGFYLHDVQQLSDDIGGQSNRYAIPVIDFCLLVQHCRRKNKIFLCCLKLV